MNVIDGLCKSQIPTNTAVSEKGNSEALTRGTKVSENGFICLFRDIRKQPWYATPHQNVFIHFLTGVQHKPGEVPFKGRKRLLLPGQMATTYSRLAKELKTSVGVVRGAIKAFEKLDQITLKTDGEGAQECTIITVKNWQKYQQFSNTVTNTAINTPANTVTNTPERPNLKVLNGGANTPDNTVTNTPANTASYTENNNVYNNIKKNSPIGANDSLLNLRSECFEIWWECWRESKTLCKGSTGKKTANGRKAFERYFDSKRLARLGVDGLKSEVNQICDFTHNALSALADDPKHPEYFNLRTMFPEKFFSTTQWRDE